jgi:protein TonB
MAALGSQRESKALAITALVLGILGLFTGGLFGVGSLLGLILAIAALMRSSPRGGRDVAWAALSANLLALLTMLPLAVAYWAYRQSPMAAVGGGDSLPEPAPDPFESLQAGPPAPAPPPPPVPAPARAPRPRAPGSAAPSAAKEPRAVEPGALAAPPVAPVRIAGAIQEPRKTRNVSPVYPRLALESRIEGVVVLECTISPAGKVVEVKTVRGVPLLDEAAITAVRQWEYTPTLLDGAPVPVIMTVTVNFRLN